MVNYVTFNLPDDIQRKALELFSVSKATGKIRKGTNEVTKAIEKGIAKLVIIAGDVNPPEIVMHLGPLCEEKQVNYIFITEKKSIGSVVGVNVGCSAAAIIDAGEGKNLLKEVIDSIKQLKK
ncbi:MAG: 50S ribosomal protein L7Ae [Candidatus Nanoarchaeia archaeon]|nr:50S ribosomal protein L7Ae [Candidatus Nanoarchaeia archaeon]MDD5054152.1 50S ribosomal protein L7Ae [Candidatus Nanoarchaeia archaeon]MDD5499535.1 50S ribosomal protein L7Ae [Candidatus Nanoarchaeia archaeon]